MKKILVIDDEPGLIHLFNEMFSDREKFQLDIAPTAFEGMNRFAKFQPDLLILDVALPDKDGRTLLDELSQNPHMKNCRVILMSGIADEEDAKLFGSVKIDYFLRKPFKVSEASKHINSLLNLNS